MGIVSLDVCCFVLAQSDFSYISLFITFDMLFSLHSTVFSGSVTHTNRQGAQWWEVDLGRVYKIHHIVIYGRTDCCSERIQGARVSI